MIALLAEVWPAIALAAGALAGLLAAFLWRRLVPPGTQSRFWKALGAVALGLWRVDDLQDFLGLYRRLVTTLAGYLARNIAAAALSIAALLLGLATAIAPLEDRRAAQGGLSSNRPAVVGTDAGGAPRAQVGALTIAPPPGEPTRLAVCWTGFDCGLASLMDFETREIAEAPEGLDGPVLVRSGPAGLNPLWPWLSDLEALYIATFIVAMSVGMLVRRARPAAAGAAPMISHGDFGLLQLNEQLGGLVRAVGRMEDKRLGPQIMTRPIERPVFVTGLARSGTTVLLNALAQAEAVGTHQYADFPFLGAPVAWRSFQRLFAREGAAVERPHKDRIIITKMSPDAFEEPLWQHYFPDSHAAGRDQHLDAADANPAFERDFPNHLRKILHLRDAARYVSKGNYNIGRLAYLAKLFPDGRFVIPIRSPLEHVASLARQHELFTAYAADDPRVPYYLASAGHYEFGPQRRAICLDAESAGAAEKLWAEEGDAAGYAWQWAHVYGHLARQLDADEGLARRVMVLRYEDLCADPPGHMAQVLEHCALTDASGRVAAFTETLSLSEAAIPPAVQAHAGRIAELTEAVAKRFGYAAA